MKLIYYRADFGTEVLSGYWNDQKSATIGKVLDHFVPENTVPSVKEDNVLKAGSDLVIQIR